MQHPSFSHHETTLTRSTFDNNREVTGRLYGINTDVFPVKSLYNPCLIRVIYGTRPYRQRPLRLSKVN